MNKKQVDPRAKTVINGRAGVVQDKSNASTGKTTGNEHEQEGRIDKVGEQVESGHGTRHEQAQS